MRELSFAQFVYFLKKVCLFFNVLFDIIVNFIIQTHFPQKVYKLSKAKISRFEGTRGDKNQIFRTSDQSSVGFYCGVRLFSFFKCKIATKPWWHKTALVYGGHESSLLLEEIWWMNVTACMWFTWPIRLENSSMIWPAASPQILLDSIYFSMTSLLAHTVAQSTKRRFLPKNLSQLVIFVIELAFTWSWVNKNHQNLIFKVNFLCQKSVWSVWSVWFLFLF